MPKIISEDHGEWADDGRKYRRTTNLLSHVDGQFEYLHASGSSKEAARKGLMTLMSGISEQFMFAGWLNNLEYTLWECRETGSCVQFPKITESQCTLLRLLSEEAEGWWMYPLDEQNPDPALEFVSLDDWRKHIERI